MLNKNCVSPINYQKIYNIAKEVTAMWGEFIEHPKLL
jgi:hypothetical protein